MKPETILGWHRKLVERKFDSSAKRSKVGRPTVAAEVEQLVVRFARENRTWGHDRIVGALANLGIKVSDRTGRRDPDATRRPTRTGAASGDDLGGVHPLASSDARSY